MDINIFKYLEKEYQELYSLGTDIDKLVFTEPYSVIVKSRVYIEKLSVEIAKLENMESLNNGNLADRLSSLSRNGILDSDIGEYFYKVRKIGNRATHDEVETELVLALNIHNYIYKITCWFIETYIDYNFKSPIYKSPKPINDTKVDKEHSSILTKLISKMDHLLHINNKEVSENSDIRQEKVNSLNIVDDVEKSVEVAVTKEAKKECLIQELSKLKESSKEAVEGLNTFSKFKTYMHVNRDVQDELQQIILEADQENSAQLILVCGSVGDGKSHIISYFKNKYPDVISNFTLHNDATESLEPNKTSMDTLNDVLDNFSDEKIETSSEKLILAINLGTLNNFIDSEYGKRFTVLQKYVESKKILEKSIIENKFDSFSNIQFINFSDYNLYTLKDGKVQSKYIKELINKITNRSEINDFYNSYKENCSTCKNKDKCPIKANYELISEDNVQNAIVDLLVQCIIKRKIIISTRALLNFMYDLIIARSYIDVNSPMFKDKIGKLKNEEYINSLTPNIIFDHKELSFIFNALSTLDPLNVRNEKIDDFIIKFNNSTELIQFFDEYIDYPKGYIEKINNVNFDELEGRRIKTNLLKLFIRSYYFCGKGELFSLNDEVYEDFIKYLYFWNKGDKAKLIGLYREIKDGILKWNGEAEKNHINIFVGKNQVKYKVSEEIELKADASNLPDNKDSDIIKFLTEMDIRYKGDKLDRSCSIDIDYSLYELLIRVRNGYRPNKKDKNHFIKFIEFINKIECAGSQNSKLIFTEKNREENKKYRLEFDEEFEIYRFMEI
ncbi:DNA phosphorothioation-dependent restriction protein DptF [Clostridium sp.]|uniref:DNA phosphorothioation-dependent restriction protein DptF n=1 Tax=Clostridium sp. TaxID=1506 RepID=UPI0026396138|nr:DNA phosphorothioation-dependent restriction protein DptF [Clostridium sp.]